MFEQDRGLRRVVATTITLVIIFLILGIYSCARDEDQAHGEVLPSKYDAELWELDRKALDDAYVAHRKLLFETWMKDPQTGPSRARVGAAHARKAYIDVRDEMGLRKPK